MVMNIKFPTLNNLHAQCNTVQNLMYVIDVIKHSKFRKAYFGINVSSASAINFKYVSVNAFPFAIYFLIDL